MKNKNKKSGTSHRFKQFIIFLSVIARHIGRHYQMHGLSCKLMVNLHFVCNANPLKIEHYAWHSASLLVSSYIVRVFN